MTYSYFYDKDMCGDYDLTYYVHSDGHYELIITVLKSSENKFFPTKIQTLQFV